MPRTKPRPVIIAGETSELLAKDIADALGTRLVTVSRKRFSDGEIKRVIEENVRGFDAVVVASASGNPNENEKETRLLLRAAGKRAGARRRTLVLPYMWYGRSDDTFGECAEPALMDTIETLSPHCEDVVIVDPHNVGMTREKFAAAANIKTSLPVQFSYVFAKQLQDMMDKGLISRDALMLAHADAGGPKRISPEFRACMYGTLKLEGRKAEQDDWPLGLKDRNKITGKSEYKGFSTDVAGKDVVVFEDMIASGGTAIELAQLLKKLGARSVTLFATSGLFTPKESTDPVDAAIRKLNASPLDAIYITDTYDHRLTNPAVHAAIEASPKIHILKTAPYLAAVIKAIHAEPDANNVDANSLTAIARGVHVNQASFATPVAYKPNMPLLGLKAA